MLLLTVDSLRRDWLACYGCNSVSTPFIDMLASAGTKFENAFSQGGGTPESFPSIMCSLPPPLTLEQRNIRGADSLAGSLRERGFKTAGFHSNPFLSARFGYSGGFDSFYEGRQSSIFMPEKANDITNAASLLLLNRAPITHGSSLVRRAIKWANSIKGPAFLWLHFMDTHFPYLPPLSASSFRENINNRVLWAILMGRRVQNKKSSVEEKTLSRIIRSYVRCVEAVDRYVSVLVSRMLNRFSDCLVIITSDHGEGFWEHGYFGHSGLYEEILRVPLVLYSNGGREVRNVAERIVTLSDLKQIIISLLEDGAYDAGGNSLLQKPGVPSSERIFLCSSLDPPLGQRSLGLRTSRLKYIRNERLADGLLLSEELYDLENDPAERVNLSTSRQEELLSMRSELAKIVEESKRLTAPLSYEEEKRISQRLRSLGYE